MHFLIIDLLLGISFFTVTILATYLLFRSRERSGKILALAAYAAAFWVLAVLAFESIGKIWHGPILFVARMQYAAGALLLMLYAFFAYIWDGKDARKIKALLAAGSAALLAFFGLILFTGAIVKDAQIFNGHQKLILGDYYYVFICYFLLLAGVGYYHLSRRILATESPIEKAQLIYILVGSIVMGVVSFLANIVMPLFGVYYLVWIGPMSAIIFTVFALYAIVHHHLFEIKAIAVEMLVFIILIIVFIQIFLVENIEEMLLRALFFLVVIILSVFLLKGIYKEIEQRERIEHLAHRLSDSISFTAHELRNPVTKFMGYLSMLLEGAHGQLQPEAKKVVESCLGNVAEMNRNIAAFLNLNKLEVGKLEIFKQKIDLQEVVKECIEDFRSEAKQKMIAITFEKKDGMPMVSADRFQIRHVINNLISNVIKYTPPGGKATISIDYDEKNQSLIFAIKDNGIGIVPDVLPYLFERYKRGGEETKAAAGGEGIGLFLAKTITELHGGKIWAESEGSGKGSRFSFSLPIEEKQITEDA